MKYERGIYKILYDLGITKPYLGCKYLAQAMCLLNQDENCIMYVTKSLYIEIAFLFHTTPNCVERNIRTIADIIWSSEDNKDTINEVFGYRYISTKPTNTEFLWLLYEYIRYNSFDDDEDAVFMNCRAV